jgi:internalin A
MFARSTICSAFNPTNVVSFGSIFVEDAVRQELELFEDRPLTESDLLRVTNLTIPTFWFPVTFEGLEYAVNLEALDTDLYDDTSLDPLVGLQHLISLGVKSGSLQDVRPILTLTNLVTLSFESAIVTNIEALANHPSLGTLAYWSSGITNAAPFTSLSVTNLSVEGNSITDVSPFLSMSRLRALSLVHNPLTNVQLVRQMTNLTGLALSDLTQCEFLTNLTSLEMLFVGGNNISNLSPLKTLSQLQFLSIGYNPRQDCSFLSNFPNLYALEASEMGLKSVSMLSGATNMQFLDLPRNQVQDLSPLASMSRLKSFFCQVNWITNVAVLTNCPELRFLYIGGNYLRNSDYNINEPSLVVFAQITARGGRVTVNSQRLWGDVKLRIIPENGAVRIHTEPTPSNLSFQVESSLNGVQWTPITSFGRLWENSISVPVSESNQFFRTSIAY